MLCAAGVILFERTLIDLNLRASVRIQDRLDSFARSPAPLLSLSCDFPPLNTLDAFVNESPLIVINMTSLRPPCAAVPHFGQPSTNRRDNVTDIDVLSPERSCGHEIDGEDEGARRRKRRRRALESELDREPARETTEWTETDDSEAQTQSSCGSEGSCGTLLSPEESIYPLPAIRSLLKSRKVIVCNATCSKSIVVVTVSSDPNKVYTRA
ncbi:hypothetical protein F2P81_006825 [Scophthalmus maximus]|uniref:Uncharacterized protein n=1 Tax=Scophthalmus maximus TaxID=52904 RepID=A0A6A4T436_SCOMX|nr:hypothetical protein F2P81_006825 [Scophthalmus maximus]